MYINVRIPADRSELAGTAVQDGIALAKRIDAKVTVLTVLPPFHVFTTDTQMLEDTPALYEARMQAHAQKTLGAVADAAEAAGVASEMVHVEHEHPYLAIIDTAKSKGCDLIVMASHGCHGIFAIVLGSETVNVLTHSKIPVLVQSLSCVAVQWGGSACVSALVESRGGVGGSQKRVSGNNAQVWPRSACSQAWQTPSSRARKAPVVRPQQW